MEDRYMFPNRYEIQQVIGEFCHRKFVDDFSQGRGIFITNAANKDIAEFYSDVLFDNEDLNLLRNAALLKNNKSVLSGFIVSSEENGTDVVSELERLRGDTVDPIYKLKLGPITSYRIGGIETHRSGVEYQQNQPGRIEFLQGIKRNFDFYVFKIEPGKWQILIDGNRSSDGGVMSDWIDRRFPRDIRFFQINFEHLTTFQTIKFFDQLALRGIDAAWRFTQVKRINLKKANASSEEAEEVQEAKTVLSGISQAILEGNDLRVNPFVRQCEDGGYRFTAMKYEYEQKDNPYVMQVRAEFKGRPKVFEVSIESYKKRVGIDGNLEDTTLQQEIKLCILAKFWAEARDLYNELMAERV